MMRLVRFLAGIVALAMLVGCAETGIRGFWTLRDADFRQLKPGITKAQVVAIVGKPPLAVTYPNLRQEVWDYGYMDSQTRMRAYVFFDAKGIFTHHVESFDMDYYSTTEGE
ncbi:MAG: outer membrane protein assembly factor BamE [Betaproteobacteria bacterium]|nr:outer membrane protein assembly factor BamE [Betaproteobacteria bacterium]